MLRGLLALSFALSAAGAHAGEQFFDANNDGQIEFMMPSGNIGCIYTPEGGTSNYTPADGGPELICDRFEPSYLRFGLGRSGQGWVSDSEGDASCCGGAVFGYDNFWRAGPFYCESSRTGLSCTRNGNGFFISRARTEAY
jgi:hypothetical protein